MKKSICAICLLLAMLLGMLSGCGSSATSSTAAEESSSVESASEASASEENNSTAESSAEESAAEESAAEESEEPSESASPAETDEAGVSDEAAASDEEEAEASKITYPISDGSITLTFFRAIPSGYLQIIEAWSDAPSYSVIEERLGIKMDIITPGEMAAQETFDLLISSGSYPDLFESNMYSTGVAQALSDGVIIPLNDLLEENAPDYMAVVDTLDQDSYNSLLDDEGNMLFMAAIAEEYVSIEGLGIRQDWLDELQLDAPSTTDELYQVLTAFKNEYGCDRTFHLEDDGIMAYVVGAFGTPGFDLTGSNGLGMYHVGDTVYSALQSDGYREYLEYVKLLYDEGLVNNEFYSFQRSYDLMMQISCYGASGIWKINTDSMISAKSTGLTEDDNYALAGISAIVKNEGDTYEFAAIPLRSASIGGGGQASVTGTVVSSTCEYPEYAVQSVNYFFTEEGELLANWGIEGDTFEYQDGELQYTDKILNSEHGYNNEKEVSTFVPCASSRDYTTFFDVYEENVTQAIETWTDVGYSSTMPNVSLTEEETGQYSSLCGDIITFAAETITKFIVGSQELTDESWAAFQQELSDSGLDECVAIYQAAYERYIAR